MGQVKPWQAVLFAVAFVAIGLCVYWSLGRSDVKLADSLRMVDVNTGEEFYLPIGKGGATIPGRNPRTNEMTLMPVIAKDRVLRIPDRYFPALREIPGSHAAVNESTREVKTTK
jgi:hypothetical protein